MYILFETHSSKIGPHSFHSTLISYKPHAKAYQCWHPPTNRIITLYNISFIESQGMSPTPLYPGHTLQPSDSTPTWETPSTSLSTASLPTDTDNDDDDGDTLPPPIPRVAHGYSTGWCSPTCTHTHKTHTHSRFYPYPHCEPTGFSNTAGTHQPIQLFHLFSF